MTAPGGRWVDIRLLDGRVRRDWIPDQQPPGPQGGPGVWHIVTDAPGQQGRWEWHPAGTAQPVNAAPPSPVAPQAAPGSWAPPPAFGPPAGGFGLSGFTPATPKKSNKRTWIIVGVVVGVLAIIGGIGSALEDKPSETAAQASAATATPKATPKPAAADAPRAASGYKVVHVLPQEGREPRYYLLMDPVDLSSGAFKAKVKAIITELVSEHGPLYIEFHDNMGSLTTSYKQYGDLSLGRNRTAAEDAEQVRHYVAQYLGGVDYTLTFFPAANSKSPGVGRYFDCCGTFEP